MREEKDKLILFSGILKAWLESKEEISFGPASTRFGKVWLSLKHEGDKIKPDWRGEWYGDPPKVEVHLGGSVIPAKAGIQKIEIIDPRLPRQGAASLKHSGMTGGDK